MAWAHDRFLLKFCRINQTCGALVNRVVRYQCVNKPRTYSYSCWDTSELYHLSAGYMGNDRLDRPLGLRPCLICLFPMYPAERWYNYYVHTYIFMHIRTYITCSMYTYNILTCCSLYSLVQCLAIRDTFLTLYFICYQQMTLLMSHSRGLSLYVDVRYHRPFVVLYCAMIFPQDG